MSTTPIDTPETDALQESYAHLGPNWLAFEVFAKASERFERRARAAEARVKELEAANADLIQRLQDRIESYLAASKRDTQTIQQQSVELDKLRAALRLHPIAEAGPVPEGMIRLYASRIPLGPPGAEFWSAFSETDEEDTHCVDVWPPSPAEESQARP